MIPAIWTAIHAKLPLHEAFRTLYACGWRAFEVSTEHMDAIEADPDPQRQIEEAVRCMNELGLIAPQAHAHLDVDVARSDVIQREKDINRLLCHLDLAARLGVKNVVIHPGGNEGFTTRAQQQRVRKLNVEAFKRLGDFAGEHKMMIGLENLMRRGASTPGELLDLLDAIGSPAIGITLDTSHANVAKLNVAEAVREFGPHLVATHISDNNGSGDQHLVPGAGTINWPDVMAAFRDIAYKGLFNLEIGGERHPVSALQQLKIRYALDVTEWLVGLADSNISSKDCGGASRNFLQYESNKSTRDRASR